MTRTNVELDDDLVATAMRRTGAKTKKDVIDLALRRLVGPPLTAEFWRELHGVGWEGDLDAMRSATAAPEL